MVSMGDRKHSFSPLVKSVVLNADQDEHVSNLDDELDYVVHIRDLLPGGSNRDVNPIRRHMWAVFNTGEGSFNYYRIGEKECVFLVPFQLQFSEVLIEFQSWGEMHNWEVRKFDVAEDTTPWDGSNTVRVKIIGFPIQCWFSKYITKAFNTFGKLLDLNPNDLPDYDRRFVEADIKCENPWRIPKYVEVIFLQRKKWCRVVVEKWMTTYSTDEEDDDDNPGPDLPDWTSESDNEIDDKDMRERRNMIRFHEKLLIRKYLEDKKQGGGEIAGSRRVLKNSEVGAPWLNSVMVHGSFAAPDPCTRVNSPEPSQRPLEFCRRKSRNWAQFADVKRRNHDNNYWAFGTSFKGILGPGPVGVCFQQKRLAREMPSVSHRNAWGGFLKAYSQLQNHDMAQKDVFQPITGVYEPSLRRHPGDSCIKNRFQGQYFHRRVQKVDRFLKSYEGRLLRGAKQSELSPSQAFSFPSIFSSSHFLSLSELSAMASEGMSDEFLKQFLEQTKLRGTDEIVVKLPERHGPSLSWDYCLMIKIMADYTVNEKTFVNLIRNTWGVHPLTTVIPHAPNMFLVHFISSEELHRILAKGAWSLRGDVILTKRVYGREQLLNLTVDEMEVWVQIHGLPDAYEDDEAILYLYKKIGIPISDPVTIQCYGHRAFKVRVMIKASKGLVDKLKVDDDYWRDFMVYFHYERIYKLCLFCGKVGHVKEVCGLRSEMMKLRAMDKYQEVAELWNITDALGKWVWDIHYIPTYLIGESSICSPWVKKGKSSQKRKEEKDEHNNLQVARVTDHGSGSTRVAKEDLRMMMAEEEADGMHLNCKRAREAIPNSPPRQP